MTGSTSEGGGRYVPSYSRGQGRHRPLQEFPSVRGLLVALAALLTLSGVIGLFAALSYKERKRAVPGNERITLDHIFNGTFRVARTDLSWVPEGMPQVGCLCDCGADGIFPFTQKPETVSSPLSKTVS